MFGLFARRTKEPTQVEMVCEVEIEASPAEVFAALDLRSETNRYRARGWTVDALEGRPGTFRAIDPNMPDLEFFFTEEARQPRVSLDLTSRFAEGVEVGSLLGGRSKYLLTPLGEGRCGVELQEAATLCAGLTKQRLCEERTMLMLAVNDDLARLKAFVEDGPEAAAKAGALDGLFAALDEAAA